MPPSRTPLVLLTLPITFNASVSAVDDILESRDSRGLFMHFHGLYNNFNAINGTHSLYILQALLRPRWALQNCALLMNAWLYMRLYPVIIYTNMLLYNVHRGATFWTFARVILGSEKNSNDSAILKLGRQQIQDEESDFWTSVLYQKILCLSSFTINFARSGCFIFRFCKSFICKKIVKLPSDTFRFGKG